MGWLWEFLQTLLIAMAMGWTYLVGRWHKDLHDWMNSFGERINIIAGRQTNHWDRMDLHEDFIANLYSVIGHPFKRPKKENAK